LLICAAINGAFFEAFLAPQFGLLPVFALSGLLLSLCIVVVSAAAIPWFGRLRATAYFLLGLFWLMLTLVFEFVFGSVYQSECFPRLLEAYIFQDGNLWPLVLVVIAFAPLFAAHLRRMLADQPE